MKIETLPKEFEDARNVLETIESAGYQAYFVGGCVRDLLLKRNLHDIDIATSAYPEEIKKNFPKTVDTGIKHGTVTVLQDKNSYEITTFRTESGYQDYRRPDKVTFVRQLSDDLKRRDFTINALALDIHGQIIDLFNGINDLNQHVIRAVGNPNERFNEDALRMMRAVRFSSQLGFDIENETFLAIKNYAYLLNKISIERIRDEFLKLMQGRYAQKGLTQMIQTELARYCPGFDGHLIDMSTIASLIKNKKMNEIEIWTMVAYHFGFSEQDTNHFLREWKVSNKEIKLTECALKVVYAQQNYQITGDLLLNLNKESIIAGVHVAQISGFHYWSLDKWLLNYNDLPIHNKNELDITGTDIIQKLNIEPGPKIGKILDKTVGAVINKKVKNNFDLLLSYIKEHILNDLVD